MLELRLSGLLLFGRNPLRWRPAFTIKAVAFIKRNLHRAQGNQGFNSPGILEVPEIALKELLVHALVHRDYVTSASIRILVFTDRLDIISPGSLPDSLSVDDIRRGKSNRRNPTLSEHAFRLLPYRGLGSGNQFTARVRRPQVQWDGTGAPAPPPPQVTGQVTDPVSDPVSDRSGPDPPRAAGH